MSYFVEKHSNFRNLEVDKIIVHEDYCADHHFGHDIALLKLKEKVDLSRHTLACLPPENEDYAGKTASVFGWGQTKDQALCRPFGNWILLTHVSSPQSTTH